MEIQFIGQHIDGSTKWLCAVCAVYAKCNICMHLYVLITHAVYKTYPNDRFSERLLYKFDAVGYNSIVCVHTYAFNCKHIYWLVICFWIFVNEITRRRPPSRFCNIFIPLSWYVVRTSQVKFTAATFYRSYTVFVSL